LSGGSKILALILTMIASLILGMGMPATAVYIVAASLLAPPLVDLGIAPISAHFFIFYFSVISCITPPVALTSYAAAGIANADANKAGWKAFYFGMLAYIIPFIFVYSPVLLWQGETVQVLTAFASAVIGVLDFGIALQGFFTSECNPIERVLFFVSGMLLIIPGTSTDIIGFAFTVLLLVLHRRKMPKAATL